MSSILTYNHNNAAYKAKQYKDNIWSLKTLTTHKSQVSPSRRLKNLLKPLLGRVFKTKAKQPKRNSYIASEEKEAEFEWLNNDMENMANEHLENRLIEELQHNKEGDAIIVYNSDGTQRLEVFDTSNYYVPVHFARTNAGTFFWTSMQRETIEPLNIEWHFLDRWAQA